MHFERNGKTYHGTLEPIKGAGRRYGEIFGLVIDKNTFGELYKTEHFGWKFNSRHGWDDLAEVLLEFLKEGRGP